MVRSLPNVVIFVVTADKTIDAADIEEAAHSLMMALADAVLLLLLLACQRLLQLPMQPQRVLARVPGCAELVHVILPRSSRCLNQGAIHNPQR